MDNGQYEALLEEIAALLQVAGANTFKVRAFERAARVLHGLSTPVDTLVDEGTLTELDGIGKSIAADLTQIRQRGSCDVLDELRASLPPGITDLLRVHGLGPKKVRKLYEELGIGDLDTLQEVAESGRIAELDGFGPTTVKKILHEIERLRASAGRVPIGPAWYAAAAVREALAAHPAVVRIEIAGSLRRGRETVKDIDLVAASDDPQAVMAAFIAVPGVREVVAHGDTKSTVRLDRDLSADLRVVPPGVFGVTLHHFTGSKDHNVLIRSRAAARGLRVSEWGVFRKNGEADEAPIACATEEDVYAAVGLPWIAPELREGQREIDLAEAGRLPRLIQEDDIRADLHMHTVDSDGANTFAEMAAAAAARGLQYICITDHSRVLTVANGLSRERLLDQIHRIRTANADGSLPIPVLCGLEVDILEAGELDMDDDVLDQLDWVVGSVHSRFQQSETAMTDRLLHAIRTGRISAVGHPTGRLIGERDPYRFDFDAICAACVEMGVALELNAAPERLDLNDALLQRALAYEGLWLTVNTDAHRTTGLGQMHFGARMARRGWTPAARVLNTLPLDGFRAARRAPGPPSA